MHIRAVSNRRAAVWRGRGACGALRKERKRGERALKQAEKNWPAGIKRTRQRESVLRVLERSDRPLSASDICSEIEKDGEAVWLSTVYRILELFEKKKLVKKADVMNREMAAYELDRPEHKHYAVCVSCHKIIPMENCPMEQFRPQMEDDGFLVTGHNLVIYGFCKDCAPK